MRGSLVRIARVLKCRSFVSGGWLSCLTCRWANNAMLQRTTNLKQVDWCDPQHFLNVLVASSLHRGSRCFFVAFMLSMWWAPMHEARSMLWPGPWSGKVFPKKTLCQKHIEMMFFSLFFSFQRFDLWSWPCGLSLCFPRLFFNLRLDRFSWVLRSPTFEAGVPFDLALFGAAFRTTDRVRTALSH